MGLSQGAKRAIVMIMAVVIAVLAAISLSFIPGLLWIILYALVIVACISGFMAALKGHQNGLLGFEIVCLCLFIYGLVGIIVDVVYNVPAHDLIWNIVVTACLLIGALSAHDLRHPIFYSSVPV